MAFKCMTGHAPEYLSSHLLPVSKLANEQFGVLEPKAKHLPFQDSLRTESFDYRTIWNNLEPSLKLRQFVHIFKSLVKEPVFRSFYKCFLVKLKKYYHVVISILVLRCNACK